MNMQPTEGLRELAFRPADYQLVYRSRDSIVEWEDIGHFSLKVEWEVSFTPSGQGREDVVGYGVAHCFPIGDALASGIDPFELMKSISADCQEVCEALFERQTHGLKESIRRQFGYAAANLDVMVINAIVIAPSHRGNGLGLAVLKRVIQRFGPQAGMVAMAPTFWMPGFWIDAATDMKWLHERDRGRVLGDQKQTDRLCDYLAELGFRRATDSGVLVLDTQAQLPPTEQLFRYPRG